MLGCLGLPLDGMEKRRNFDHEKSTDWDNRICAKGRPVRHFMEVGDHAVANLATRLKPPRERN